MKPLNQWTQQDLIDFLKGVDKKTWLAIGIGLLGALVLWFLLISPAWIDRLRLRHEIQNMDAQLRQYQVLNQKRLELEKNEKLFTQLFEDVKSRLYREGDIALILGQVSKLATEAKVDMIASKPKTDSVVFPEPYGDQYRAVSYAFTMQGGYHQLGAFSAALESFPKLLRIQKIQILPVPDDPERHIAQFDLIAIADRTGVPATAGQDNAQKK